MNEKYPLALPAGSVLAGQYIVEKVLGQGGFGITYEVTDHKTGEKVAVKEFFPDAMATRTNQTMVMPFSGERGESFEYGKTCFIQEAETLAEFIGNENIVRIRSYFEENGTAYLVMDFIEGTSFDEYLKQRGGKIPFEEAAKILVPVMDALSDVHSKGIVHRDVTPDNIYITKEGIVKLLDFGAARYSLGDKSRSLDIVLKHGFAPKEQYTRRGRQGPYTDIYSLGATFYFALTGRRPPDSVERMDEDDLVPPGTLGVQISEAAEAAILTALSVQPADRFQSMVAFKNAMLFCQSESVQPVPPISPTAVQTFYAAPDQQNRVPRSETTPFIPGPAPHNPDFAPEPAPHASEPATFVPGSAPHNPEFGPGPALGTPEPAAFVPGPAPHNPEFGPGPAPGTPEPVAFVPGPAPHNPEFAPEPVPRAPEPAFYNPEFASGTPEPAPFTPEHAPTPDPEPNQASEIQSTVMLEQDVDSHNNPLSQVKEKSSKKMGLYIGIAAVVVIVVIGILVAIFLSRKLHYYYTAASSAQKPTTSVTQAPEFEESTAQMEGAAQQTTPLGMSQVCQKICLSSAILPEIS